LSLEQIQRALNVSDVSLAERAVLLVLAWYADADGRRAYPSIATLAKQSSADVRTVQRVLTRLRSAGLVEVQERAFGHLPTCYALHLPDVPIPGTTPPRRNATPGTTPSHTPGTVSQTPGTVSETPRHSATQSFRDPSVNKKDAGGRATPGRVPPPRGNGSDRIAPPANLHDTSPRFPAPVAPGTDTTADAATSAEIAARLARKPAQ
jgi:helix-turn-helix protein